MNDNVFLITVLVITLIFGLALAFVIEKTSVGEHYKGHIIVGRVDSGSM